MPWLRLMGFRFSFLFAAPMLLAAPVLAQQENGAEPVFNLPRSQPQTPTDRQGPELDVFRGAPATVTPPPVVAPTIQVPPPVTPAPQPAPQPSRSRPAEVRPAPQPTPPASDQTNETTPAPQVVESQPPIPAESNASAVPEAVPLAPAEEPASRWPWIAAAAAGAVMLTGAFLWLRRRKPEEVEESYEETEPARPAPAQPKATPVPPPASGKPEPGDRPWLDISMEVQAARLTLMGATIGYALTVHNRGERTAEDILVRSLIANADAQQQALFQQFFAGETGLPVHSIVSIAPGGTQTLTGEMRLDAQAIEAIRMGQRALLIPIIAFDAQYRWAGESEGIGRTGRAFIVGEEQSPQVERLSPFRLDLGPRQYRAPGSRATALSLAS
ncbi:hypothetical protein NUH86_15245 [Sphingobium sp. JS3065]|uniref:hypothetical protein n=1 Tax=Sphingobium sp. JS3065 TaxID=2970925 RepID=UPI002263D970|nr:hypothetical protein [Sphingobium sp. JS3065]UZW54819.1 hypothetical protein NUH86_15245 [Sphingobium sp. JS3065]